MLGCETETVNSTAIQEQRDAVKSLAKISTETSPTLDEVVESIPMRITLYVSNQVQEAELGDQLKNVIKNGFRRICERLVISEEECARILTMNNEIVVNIMYDITRNNARGNMDGYINLFTNSLDSEEFEYVFLHEFVHYLNSPNWDPRDPSTREVLEEGSTTILSSFGVQYDVSTRYPNSLYPSYTFITSLLGSDFLKLRLTDPEKYLNLIRVNSTTRELEILKLHLESNFTKMNLNLSEDTKNYILEIIFNSTDGSVFNPDYYRNAVETILDRISADNSDLSTDEIYAIIRNNCLHLDVCTVDNINTRTTERPRDEGTVTQPTATATPR